MESLKKMTEFEFESMVDDLVDDRWKKYHEEESVHHEWWLHKFKLLRNNSISIREQRQAYRKVSKPVQNLGPGRSSGDGQFCYQSILWPLKSLKPFSTGISKVFDGNGTFLGKSSYEVNAQFLSYLRIENATIIHRIWARCSRTSLVLGCPIATYPPAFTRKKILRI